MGGEVGLNPAAKGNPATRKAALDAALAITTAAVPNGAIVGAMKALASVDSVKDNDRTDDEAKNVVAEKPVEGEEPVASGEEVELVSENEDTEPQADVVHLPMNKDGNVIFWYQTAEAYEIPEGLGTKDIYNKIRDLNGDPEHNKYAPDEVGLPREITIEKDGQTYTVTRKDAFDIKGVHYKAIPHSTRPLAGKAEGYKPTEPTPVAEPKPEVEPKEPTEE